jgi:uncharacterized membrane protein
MDRIVGVRSRATIGGHPIHPMLIPFPIAFLVGAFLADVVFWRSADLFWARAAAWLVGAGLVSAGLAAIFGLTDFLLIKRVQRLGAAWRHLILNLIIVALTIWNLLIRLDSPAAQIVWKGLVLSTIVVVLLLASGWFGGELAYRHKIGAIDGEKE